MYTAFKDKYPTKKIGFSTFCTLRPKWCVGAGSSGTHSVCVCTIHQNTVLHVETIKWNHTYKDLIQKVVCDVHSNECMIHRCENCPGSEALRIFMKEELCHFEQDEEFHFSQWRSTDRTALITQTCSIEEYIEIVVEAIDNLTAHSYIAKSQAKFLREKRKFETGRMHSFG